VKFKQLNITEIIADDNIRSKITKESIEGLMQSIKENGILQPLLVRLVDNGKYNLVAGYRRRAAAMGAGLDTVPCVIQDIREENRETVQLIENIQREDLDTIDESLAIKQIVDKYGVEDGAMAIGKKPLYITQRIKLLDLPKIIKEALTAKMISVGHGIVLSRLVDSKVQVNMFKEIVSEKMSVKQAENELDNYTQRLGNAAFDKTQCKDCVHSGINQGDFFDEDSELKGECLDKECFAKKVKEHIASRKKETGVTVLTVDEYNDNYNKWESLNGWSAEDDLGKASIKRLIESGENVSVMFDDVTGSETFYMNAPAYKGLVKKLKQLKMSKGKKKNGKDEEPIDERALAKKANRISETQRRFLIERLEAKATPTQLHRVILEIMFNADKISGMDIYEFLVAQGKMKSSEEGSCNHMVRWDIEKQLANCDEKAIKSEIFSAARRNINRHDTEYLIATAKEIGIDMSQFRIDEEYLKKFTKDELIKMGKEVKSAIPKDVQKKSKKDMIDYILERKLAIVPKELLKK